MSYEAVEKGKREESSRCRGGSGTARAGNNGLFRIGMTVQSLFFTRCPWRDTKSAHARDPPLDGLYRRSVRVLGVGANHGLT